MLFHRTPLYGRPAGVTRFITVTNTSDRDFADVRASVPESGFFCLTPNYDSENAKVTNLNLGNIAAGLSKTFVVWPREDLPAWTGNTYTNAVTISAQGAKSVSFTAAIVISKADYAVVIEGALGVYDFGEVQSNYDAGLLQQTLTVRNVGENPLGMMSLDLSGNDKDEFEVSPGRITSLAPEVTSELTVKPASGLSVKAGNYQALLTLSGNDGFNPQTLLLRIAVARYDINVSQTAALVFPPVSNIYKQENLSAQTVTVTNTGTHNTGPLSVGISNGIGSVNGTADDDSYDWDNGPESDIVINRVPPLSFQKPV
jgi:hypothetical protein